MVLFETILNLLWMTLPFLCDQKLELWFDADLQARNEDAKHLIMERVGLIRKGIAKLALGMADSKANSGTMIDHATPSPLTASAVQQDKRSSVICDSGSNHALLFLQLVEHLALQSLSLYDAWR
jgi:hypothetical protein